MDAGQFRATVKELGGPENQEQLTNTIETVLGNLGKRLQGGEPHDLAAQLPEEFQSAVTVQTDAQPITDDVDDFLRRVADQLGTNPEEARPQVHAVLGTVARAVTDGELEDLRSQLPAGYGPLFEYPTSRAAKEEDMQPTEITQRVQQRAGLDSFEEANDTVLALLEALAYRDLGEQREAFAAQLPKEYAEVLAEAVPVNKEQFDADDMMRRVGKHRDTTLGESRTRTHAAFSVLMDAVSDGQVQDLLNVLPADYASYAAWDS